MSTEKDIAERLQAAFVQHHGNKVGDPFVSQIAREIAAVASGIEARSGETAKPARSEGREPVPKGTPILSVVGEVVEAARELSSALDAADDEVSKFEAERRAWSSAPAVRALHARTSLRAALAKLTGSAPPAPASAVPDGWQIVPKIATEEMVEAAWEGCNRIGEHDCITLFGDAYAKALAAAPPAPASDVAALKETDHDR